MLYKKHSRAYIVTNYKLVKVYTLFFQWMCMYVEARFSAPNLIQLRFKQKFPIHILHILIIVEKKK